MTPSRVIRVPVRWFTRFVDRPEVQAAFGVVLICTAVVAAWLAYRQWDESRDTKQAARAACLRSQQLAPPLLDHFESFRGTSHALPEDVLRAYRLTVPKTCPS